MRILVFQHLAVEHPGVFREFWDEKGHEWVPVELDAGEAIPDMEGFDLLAVMGGPMDVWQEDLHPWLVTEKAAIQHWVRDLGRPYLGLCLGHQLLADALGGRVSLMARPEVGLCNVQLTEAGRKDAVLAGVPDVIETLQWHGAEIASLPVGGVVLAANEACPIQAFRWGDKAYGFQFHTEITSSTVADWKRVPEYEASLERAIGHLEAAKLGDLVAPKLVEFRAVAARINANLMALC
jgi:GMP synthase-like glutamine amidotransferase